MTPIDAPYQKETISRNQYMDSFKKINSQHKTFEDKYAYFKSREQTYDNNQQILNELQNLRKELKEVKSELSFIKNSLGDHFLVKGKWIHIDHFKPIFLGKDD